MAPLTEDEFEHIEDTVARTAKDPMRNKGIGLGRTTPG
jgi:hypothetical protein